MRRIRGAVKHILANRRGVFRAFAQTYDMVYFGTIGAADEDHRIVRGVTASAHHVDNHYCVGTVHGYDAVMVERVDTLKEPVTKNREQYRWVILQIDLQRAHHTPHTFLDGGHYGTIFYRQAFVKLAHLAKVDAHFLPNAEPSFSNRFSVYTSVANISDVALQLNREITATLAAHFTHLDFEWREDTLLVYCNTKTPTKHLLEHILRAGLWLARELDASTVTTSNNHTVAQPTVPMTVTHSSTTPEHRPGGITPPQLQ